MLIRVQSGGIPLNEWLAQFTLCFAPFATHIFTGIPTFIYLRTPGPSWHHIVNFFNPTTIVWRYLTVTDRRIRCTRWTPFTLAASNAAFWTGGAWCGDERIMVASEAWNLHRPAKTRARFLSLSVLGTLLVITQGVQALYEVIAQIKTGFSLIQSLAGVFIPLAIISLMRLAPAPWLTNELAYRQLTPADGMWKAGDIELAEGWQRSSYRPVPDSFLNPYSLDESPAPGTNSAGMRTQPYLPSILLRAVSLLLLLGFIVIGIAHVVKDGGFTSATFNLSVVLIHSLYQIFLLATVLIFASYLRNHGDTTIIPCIGAWWYTAYTIFWYAFVVVTITVNALETRRTSCGVYTTWPASAGLDDRLCALYGT